MDYHLESLRTENRKLKGKHNELKTDLTEEKEMVKYLHGVIKNYQHLLRQPDATRHHIKSSSCRNVRRSNSAKSQASESSESSTEETFIKKFAEMKSVPEARKVSEGRNALSVPNDAASFLDSTGGEDNIIYHNHGKTSENDKMLRKHKDRHVSSSRRLDLPLEEEPDERRDALSTLSYAAPFSDTTGCEHSIINPNQGETSDNENIARKRKDRHVSSSRRSDLPLKEKPDPDENKPQNCSEDQTKPTRDAIIREMAGMLDTMMDKANKHMKSLERKDKHLVRVERRLEYLESIALGEESEWL